MAAFTTAISDSEAFATVYNGGEGGHSHSKASQDGTRKTRTTAVFVCLFLVTARHLKMGPGKCV